jgi:hypothetical protein
MRLIKVLDLVNQIEKSSFLKILDGFCVELRKTTPKIDEILSECEGQLKNVDNQNIVNLFTLLRDRYGNQLSDKIKFSNYQLDILIYILTRDGNSMMSREWFLKLYNNEMAKLQSHLKAFSSQLGSEISNLDPQRERDYLVYQNCIRIAYENDLQINRDKNLSWEEKTILHTLARTLELSNEEVRWITYTVVPLKKFNIDEIITELKESGIVFFNRRSSTIFVPDEIIWLLRDFLGLEIPNKYLRRILRHLSDAEINLVARKHNIDRKLKRNEKIQEILNQGLNVTNLLTNEIFKTGTPKSDRTNRIQSLMSKDLKIDLSRYGTSLEKKVATLINYFNESEKDETTSLSHDGYDRLLKDLKNVYPVVNKRLKEDFELQPDDVMSPEILDDYNIKPRDVIYLLAKDELRNFCKSCGIKSVGNLVSNVIKKYRNIEDLYLENFDLVGGRDLKSLREKGLTVKEGELSSLYEKLTKKAFTKLGFNVDERLRKQINTKRSQMDILLNLGGKDVMIVECKTVKKKIYSKYSSVSRQLKSYEKLCREKGYNVTHILIVSNEFSEDFISECEYDYELNLSLVTSRGLIKILEGFKNSHLTEFPSRLLLKSGLLNEDRIEKVLSK